MRYEGTVTIGFKNVEKIKSEVLQYLGRRGQIVPDDLNNLVEECIALMQKAASSRHVRLSFSVSHDNDSFYLAAAGILLQGKDIVRHLSGCSQAVLLAATLGAEADALIHRWKRVDITRSLILDACATQFIEGYCDEIQQQICAEAAASNLVATWRFSPGYGDFSLDIQPKILEALNASRRIGLTCTEHFIMLPRKSVTAVIGLTGEAGFNDKADSQTGAFGGRRFDSAPACGGCALRDTCNFRKD